MDIARAFIIAFMPIAIFAFMVTYLAYRNGDVSIDDDKEDEWGFTASDSDDDERPVNNYLHKKWLSFGGGYYGLVALITFIVIEVREVFGFFLAFEGFAALWELIQERNFISDFIKAQIMNFVDALVWFRYWPDYIQMDNGWTWLGMSYAGYYVGNWIAGRALAPNQNELGDQ